MKRKLVCVLTVLSIGMGVISGNSITKVTYTSKVMAKDSMSLDKDKAKEVADLIDSIYVQERTEETDELCIKARKAWDNLTDSQKELVEGEFADPDYFGKDTGDAIKDDPLNSDDIGENEILVVSFGTSYNDSRVEDIGGIEAAIKLDNKHWSVRRAFTAQIIINHVQARDGEKIDNVEQAIERAVSNGVKNLVIQPTHLMHGAEYDELVEVVSKYKDKFDVLKISEPLLGEVGSSDTEVNKDEETVAEVVVDAAVKKAGYDRLTDMDQDNTALVLMGHGTSHKAKVTYSQMQAQFNKLGYSNVFVGTVEGEPEETSCENVIEKIWTLGYKKVILRPLMVVAGDHANNDMAGDEEDSWKNQFKNSGYFEEVDCQIEGLGRIKEIQDLYKSHLKEAIVDFRSEEARTVDTSTFDAEFKTDSSMFKVCEPHNDKGTIYEKDGVEYIHISLPSQNIVNMYLGKAEDAEKEGAKLLTPTKDIIKYSDGSTEIVNGFDIPYPYLNKEFDLAILGTKGKWYNHKVTVNMLD